MFLKNGLRIYILYLKFQIFIDFNLIPFIHPFFNILISILKFNILIILLIFNLMKQSYHLIDNSFMFCQVLSINHIICNHFFKINSLEWLSCLRKQEISVILKSNYLVFKFFDSLNPLFFIYCEELLYKLKQKESSFFTLSWSLLYHFLDSTIKFK